VIRGDGVTFHAVYTPGRASEHLCYYLEEERQRRSPPAMARHPANSTHLENTRVHC
jgi:glyoxylase-like metal-dependent hydrolase (beta-lactamase superfamily II)